MHRRAAHSELLIAVTSFQTSVCQERAACKTASCVRGYLGALSRPACLLLWSLLSIVCGCAYICKHVCIPVHVCMCMSVCACVPICMFVDVHGQGVGHVSHSNSRVDCSPH